MDIFSHFNLSAWVIQSIAMLITAILIPRFTVSGPLAAFAVVIGLSFVNTHIWDAALFFSVPNSFSTHALTLLVANGVIFWILAWILPGIEIEGILPALIAPVVFTITAFLLNQYEDRIDWKKVSVRALHFIEGVKTDLEEQKHPIITPPPANTH